MYSVSTCNIELNVYPCLLKMLITLNINNNSSITVPVDRVSSSLMIMSVINNSKISSSTVDLKVPDKYIPVFQHYNSYLLREDVIIEDVNSLLLCLELAIYCEDEQFLSLLMYKVYMMCGTTFILVFHMTERCF